MKRRKFLQSAAISLGAFPACTALDKSPADNFRKVAGVGRAPSGGDPRIRGAFPILSVPFLESGAVDYAALENEAKFVAECGCQGMIFPQSDDGVDLLSTDEKLAGMEAVVRAAQNTSTTATLGCEGKDTEEMIICAEHAEKLAAKYPSANVAIISRPPDNGKTEDDLRKYYLELEKRVNRPVIIQTGGGVAYGGVAPSVGLLLELAKRNPKVFGYIKEESGDCNSRMALEIEKKPLVHTVFSAWGSYQWVHQARRIGTEGVISERSAYADLLAYIWEQLENGDKYGTLTDAWAKYVMMLNLKDYIRADQLRGHHLYVLQKRGIFKNLLSREFEWKNGKRIIPKNIILRELKLTQAQKDEVETCFAALTPYLKVDAKA